MRISKKHTANRLTNKKIKSLFLNFSSKKFLILTNKYRNSSIKNEIYELYFKNDWPE